MKIYIMSPNYELLDSLRKETSNLVNNDKNWNKVIARAEMIVKKIFGNNSEYIEKIKSFDFSGYISINDGSHSAFLNTHRDKLIGLIDVMLEDIQLSEESEPQNNKLVVESNTESTMSPIKIFISHSSKDKEIISHLIELLTGVFSDLSDEHIRCSSIHGYGFKTGEDFLDEIKKDSDFCEIVLSVLTDNSIGSKMYLIESGIAWYFNKLFPVILDEYMEYNKVPTIFSTKIARKLFEGEAVHQFLNDLSSKLNLKMKESVIVNKRVNKYLEAI